MASNSRDDLNKLMEINIRDYQMIDVVGKGNNVYKKVIAQEVERVYPRAITKSPSIVPNVYKKADKVRQKEQELTLYSKNHGLVAGDTVRLIMEHVGTKEVVIDAHGSHSFTVKLDSEVAVGEVFIYGKRVDDFHSVDYDALSMLNISATQELAKQLNEKDKEINELKSMVEALTNRMNTMDGGGN